MSGRLAGKVAVVTGASSGIGAAIARGLAGEGAAVVGLARRFAEQAALAPEPGRVVEARLDVTDEAVVTALLGGLPRIDVLVNAAGVGTFGRLVDSSTEDLRAMLEVHVVGTFLCCQAALRQMAGQGSGHILNITSTAVHSTFTECAGYTAAKCGQLGLSRVLREECRELGVRVTTLAPGAVDTPIWDDRPGFDRAKMLAPDQLAELVVEVVARPELAVEDLLVVPPAGNL